MKTLLPVMLILAAGCSMLPVSREITTQEADTQRRAAESAATIEGARGQAADVAGRWTTVGDEIDMALETVGPADVAAEMPASEVYSVTVPPLKLARYEAQHTTQSMQSIDDALAQAQGKADRNVRANRGGWQIKSWTWWVVGLALIAFVGGVPMLLWLVQTLRSLMHGIAQIAKYSPAPNERFKKSVRRKMEE